LEYGTDIEIEQLLLSLLIKKAIFVTKRFLILTIGPALQKSSENFKEFKKANE